MNGYVVASGKQLLSAPSQTKVLCYISLPSRYLQKEIASRLSKIDYEALVLTRIE